MKYSCIILKDAGVQNHLAFLEKELNYDFTPKQLVTIWNRWIDNDINKLGNNPTVEEIVETYTRIENTSQEEKFLNESISDKTDTVDYLQYLYFKGIKALSNSSVITREVIKEYQGKVFEKMPGILRKNGLESIADNFEEYKQYLIKQRLEKLNVPEEIEEEEQVKDNVSNGSSIFTDVFNSGSDEAKWLIASLESNQDNNGVNRPVNFTEVKNTLQNYLGNTLNFVQQANKLVEIKDKYYWVPELMEKLGIVDTNDFMPEGIYGSVRTSFSETFAKQVSDITITTIGGKDSYSAIDQKQKLNIKEKAQTKFWSSKNSILKNGVRVLNTAVYKALDLSLSESDLIDFIEFFGIDLNPNVEFTDQLKADMIQIKKAVDKAIKEGQEIQWLDDKILDVKNRVQNILQAQVPFEKENKQLSVNNSEGKQQHAVSNHNYFSRTVVRLQSGLKEAKNAFERLFSEGKAILTTISGATDSKNENKSTFNKLNITDILDTQLSDMFSSKPIIHLPRTEAKTTERGTTIIDNSNLNSQMAYTDITPAVMKNLYNAYLSDKGQTFHPDWTYAKDSNPLTFWESLGIKPETTEQEFSKIIKDKIQNLQLETYKLLEENKLFVKSDGGLKVMFSDSALLKMGWNNVPKGQNKEEYQRGLLLKLINNFNFNSLYFGVLSTQTLQGSMSGVNLNNFFKRTAGPVAESRQGRVDSLIVEELNAEMRQLGLTTFDAAKLTVQVHTETEEATKDKKILKISDAYKSNNVDDAQGIMVFPMYKAVLKMSSQWTTQQEKAYQKIMKGEKLSENEKGLFPPIKPVGFSVINKDGYRVPIYIKTAVYPMSPADVVGTENEAKYNQSIERGIGLWIPKSGIKMATPSDLKSYSEGINEAAIFDFPMEDFGIQLDIMPKESTKQLIGTQQRKLKWNNLFEFGKAFNDKFQKLFEEDKTNIQEMADIQRKKLYKEMGITQEGDDIFIKDFSKFKELIKAELISRENPINTIEAINDVIDQDGNVILTIDSLPSRQKVMNMLNAIVNNRLIKQYTNGTALVQISQQGWKMPKDSTIDTPTSIDFINDEAKQNYIDNEGLSFFKLGETTGAAECVLPAKFKKYIKEDGTIDPEVLINIGYRIPTQGHNSMLHLKVVGFLPAHLDQMIILPKEITTQGGSDFDVDKINIFVPNLTADGRYISPEMDPEKEYNDFKNKLDTLLTYIKDGLERKRLVIAEELSIDEFSERLKRDGSIKLTEQEIKDTLEFAGYTPNILTQIDKKLEKLANKEEFIQKFKEKQLQNKNIEITVAILEDSQQANSLITPNSPGALKKLSESITKDILEAKKPLKNFKVELSNMFNGVTLAKITSQMFASKALVGVFASQATHHTLAQQVGLHFKTTKRPFYFDHNMVEIKGELYSSLSNVKNRAGELISDILGNNYLTAAVDSAKDDYLTELGITLDTGSSAALFERLGGNREYFTAWINQPIVQDYIKLSKYYKSLTYKSLSQTEKKKTDIINEIAAKYNLGKDNIAYLLERKSWMSDKLNSINSSRKAAGEYSISDLKSNWLYGSVSGKVNQLNMIRDLFDDYLYFEEAAMTLSESISTSKFDTSGPGKDIVESEQLKAKYLGFIDKMSGSEGFTLGTIDNDNVAPYDRLITNTLLNTFYNNSWKFIIPLYKPLVMMYKNSYINSALLNLINTGKTMVVKKASVYEANNIYGALLNYVIQNSKSVNKELFFNIGGKEDTDNTLGKKIIDIQNDPKHILHNNAVIKDLFNVKQSNKSDVPTLLIPRYRNYSVDDSTTFTRAFEEIKLLDPNLYDDFVTVSLFQTGVVQSPSSFYNLLPHKDTANVFQEALNNMDATTLDYVKGVMQNIGNTLSNLKTMDVKLEVLPDVLKLDEKQENSSEGFDFIKFYGNNDSAIYQKLEPGKYMKLKSTNFGSLFYDFTSNPEFISESDINEDYDEVDNYTPTDDELISMGLEIGKPQVTQILTKPVNDVKIISEDYGVVQVETIPSKEKTEQFVNLIKPQIKKQTYKENKGKFANEMFHYGLMWARNNPKANPVKIQKFEGINNNYYNYHELDQNGNILPPINVLQPIIDEIQKNLGIDMSNYDSVIGNIYLDDQYVYPHKDTTESKTARNYPVIVYTIGNDAGLGIVDNNKGKMTFANQYDKQWLPEKEKLKGYTNELQTKNGSIYTFGLNGKGRFELTHSTPMNNKKMKDFPPIVLPNGKVITKYTITLTFRRAADLEPGMPTAPAKLTITQPSTILPGSETKINIYAGTGENAELSNFANRPTTYNTAAVEGFFGTPEGAFQAAKISYTENLTDEQKIDNSIIFEKLKSASGSQAKSLGRTIKGLNQSDWNNDSSDVMLDILIDSFRQNPNALAKLLATGDATLTHKYGGVEQDKGRFSKLLMQVRNELKATQPQVVTQNAWSNLNAEQTANLSKVGITEELFNNSSTEEQQKAIKCHG